MFDRAGPVPASTNLPLSDARIPRASKITLFQLADPAPKALEPCSIIEGLNNSSCDL